MLRHFECVPSQPLLYRSQWQQSVSSAERWEVLFDMHMRPYMLVRGPRRMRSRKKLIARREDSGAM